MSKKCLFNLYAWLIQNSGYEIFSPSQFGYFLTIFQIQVSILRTWCHYDVCSFVCFFFHVEAFRNPSILKLMVVTCVLFSFNVLVLDGSFQLRWSYFSVTVSFLVLFFGQLSSMLFYSNAQPPCLSLWFLKLFCFLSIFFF